MREMKTYYAVCDCNGPISKTIEAESVADAVDQFEAADIREWIDRAETDAEDGLEIEGADNMSELEFWDALESAGCEQVADLSEIVVGQGPTTRMAHIVGGWTLWQGPQ